MGHSVLLADPPWKYNDYGAPAGEVHDRARGAAKHYPCMPMKQIMDLPIYRLEAKVLFLWTTWPMIEDAFRLMASWGYEYKTVAWVWVKMTKKGDRPIMGMGNYTRSNTEPCLLAFHRGDAVPVSDRGVSSVIMAPRGEHSRKPEEQYEKINRLYPHADRYIELFAREQRDGWEVWGDEVASTIVLPQTGGENGSMIRSSRL